MAGHVAPREGAAAYLELRLDVDIHIIGVIPFRLVPPSTSAAAPANAGAATSPHSFLSDRPVPTEADGKGRPFRASQQSADGTGEPRLVGGEDSLSGRVATTGYDAKAAVLSPDSRWIAYVSDEQGANEVFVRPFPDVNGGKWQVSSGGGSAPLWAHNGRELFTPDDRRFLMVRDNSWGEMAGTPTLVVMHGFLDERRAKLTE